MGYIVWVTLCGLHCVGHIVRDITCVSYLVWQFCPIYDCHICQVCHFHKCQVLGWWSVTSTVWLMAVPLAKIYIRKVYQISIWKSLKRKNKFSFAETLILNRNNDSKKIEPITMKLKIMTNLLGSIFLTVSFRRLFPHHQSTFSWLWR